MKLEDFNKFRNTVLTGIETDLRGFLQETFLTNREYAVQLTDEEMHKLEHEIKTHVANTNLLSLIKLEADFAVTGVYNAKTS